MHLNKKDVQALINHIQACISETTGILIDITGTGREPDISGQDVSDVEPLAFGDELVMVRDSLSDALQTVKGISKDLECEEV